MLLGGIVAVCLAAAPASPAAGPAVADDLLLGRALVRAINDTRAENGLRALRPLKALTRAALGHARSLAALGVFSHAPVRSVAAAYAQGTKSWAIGEIMLWVRGALSEEEVVGRWLASDRHRRDLLGRWHHIGVGVVHAKNAPGVYGGRDVTIVVVDFGRRS